MNNVPNLRFKEFSGEWESVMLKDVASIVGGGTPSTTEERYWNGKIPWFTPTEIKEEKYVYESQRTITEEGLQKSSAKLLPKGSILLTTRASLGDMAISIREVSTNQGFQSIIVKDGTSNEFIYYLQPKIKKYCYTKASGSTFLEISKNNIEKFTFRIPNLNEQEKIASFFSLIDKKIELQTEKVEQLKNYKRGIMQKIFSQELRFKDENGNDFPNWKQYKVKDLFDVTRGVVIAKNEISDKSNETFKYAVYSSQTSNKGILGYDQTFDFDGNYLTWTTDGANAGRVFCRSGKFRCTNVCGVLVEKDNTIGYANKLVAEILNKETPKHVSYVGNPKLMNGVMAEIKLSIPSLEEQIKIDKLINQLDIKIENEQMKLSLLVDYKKGLLQQMFI